MRAYPYIGVPADPTTTAFTPDVVRVYLGYDTGDTTSLTDQEANDLMFAAQGVFERCTKLTLFDTTFTTLRDCFHDKHGTNIKLRRAPAQSITTIKHLIEDVLTLVDASVYKLIRAKQNNFGSASLRQVQFWPVGTDAEQESVEIVFLAGFGPDGASLPADLKAGLLRIIADIFANKGDCGGDCALAGGVTEARINSGALALINKFRILEI